MKIIDRLLGRKPVPLSSLPCGDVFEYEKTIYVKSSAWDGRTVEGAGWPFNLCVLFTLGRIDGIDSTPCLTVNAKTGEIGVMHPDALVFPLKAELVLSGAK